MTTLKEVAYYSAPSRTNSRESIIHVQGNFCNLYDSLGIPIFDAFIDHLVYNDIHRAFEWANRIKDNGGTHINLDLSGDYAENLGWAPRYPIPGSDWTENLDGLSRVIDWCLNRNLIPHLHLAADGQAYDPVGWTYGWFWGMRYLPEKIDVLKSRFPNCMLWNTGWDGCFPSWDSNQTLAFLRMLRDVLGEFECISTEFGGPGSVGYCHMGNGSADWIANKLGILDAFLIENNVYPPDVNGVQQTLARLIPVKTQKNISDANAYFDHGVRTSYLEQAKLTKEIAIVDFENVAFQFIRKEISEYQARTSASVYSFYGCKYFGNGYPV